MAWERTAGGREDVDKRRARQVTDKYRLNRNRRDRERATQRDLATIERLTNGTTE